MKRLLSALFLAVGVATLTPAEGSAAQERIDVIGIELSGPLDEVGLEAGGGETWVRISLTAGERRSLDLPLLAGRAGEGVLRPSLLPGAEADQVSFVPGSRRRPLSPGALPPRLLGRPLPGLVASDPSPGIARLALVVAAALVVLGVRRRPRMAFFCGLAAAAAIALLPASPPASPKVRILEGDRATGRVLEVRGALDSLRVPVVEPGWWSFRPSSVEARIEVTARAGETSWALEGSGARITFSRIHPARWEDAIGSLEFRRVWARRPGEDWRYREGWHPSLGNSFSGLEESLAPPGWLVSALPQGVEVFLGEAIDRSGVPTWVRLF